MRRRHVLAIGLPALTALVGAFSMTGGVTAQTAPQPDLVAIYRADVDARNRGDITTAMSFYADDAVQIGGPCGAASCVGKAAVQRGAETQIANHAQLTIVGTPQVSGNVLTKSRRDTQ